MSQSEVRERMMHAVEARVSSDGLSAGLNHLVMQQLVDEAGVSRTAVHRIWGGKENFFAEAILYLIDPGDGRDVASYSQATVDISNEVIGANLEMLLTPEGRARLLREAVRLAAKCNFDVIGASVQWRSTMALNCARPEVPDEYRSQIEAALRRVEERFTTKMVTFYNQMLAFFHRRPIAGVTVEQIVAAGAAVVEGLVIKAGLIPETVGSPIPLPDLEGQQIDWHLASVAYLGVIEALTEPVSGELVERLLLPYGA